MAGPVRTTLSEGLDSIKASPFVIETPTGALLLNFDPQRGMKGYFDFEVSEIMMTMDVSERILYVKEPNPAD